MYICFPGVSGRNFELCFHVTGCLVGIEVYTYSVYFSISDRTLYSVSRPIKGGERISVAAFKDKILEEALKGLLTLTVEQ